MPRLPKPGGDAGNWGEILNEFLSVEHTSDGKLNPSGTISLKYTKPETGIPKTDLESSLQADINKIPTHDTTLTAIQQDGWVTRDRLAEDVKASVDEIPLLRGRHELALYDEFARYQDGPLDGLTPLTGPSWFTSGGSPTQVIDGLAISNGGTGYLFATFEEPVHYLEATMVSFGSPANGNMTMAWSGGGNGGLYDLLHCNVGPTGFNLTVRQDGEIVGGTFPGLLNGAWNRPIPSDGTTRYRVGVLVRGQSCTIIGPNGEIFSATDPRVAQLSQSSKVFWEPAGQLTGDGTALVSVRAVRYAEVVTPEELLSAMDFAMSGVSNGPKGQLIANREAFAQVLIGQGPSSGLPEVVFGPQAIRTRLYEDVAAGSTSIKTEDPLVGGASVRIGGGNNADELTTSGNPSPLPGIGAPYTQVLTSPITKAHGKGDVVYVTGLTQGYIRYNPFAGVKYEVPGAINISGDFYRNSSKVITSRRTGWTAATGTADRTSFNTATATAEDIAKRLKALIDDLITHGLIGS